jgi:hypothetical protein
MSDGIVAEGAKVEVNTGSVATPIWTPIAERSQASITKSGETIDMTSFDDEGFRSFRPGLRNATLSANGNYVPSDAGYVVLEDAWLEGTVVPGIRVMWVSNPDEATPEYVGWQWDGCIVTDLGEDGAVGDKVNLTLSLQLNGRPTKVTA